MKPSLTKKYLVSLSLPNPIFTSAQDLQAAIYKEAALSRKSIRPRATCGNLEGEIQKISEIFSSVKEDKLESQLKEIVEITSNIDVATCSDTEINGISEEVKIQFEADLAMGSINGFV